jgi:hypothetical protein
MKVFESKVLGLKCDAPGCDYKDMAIKTEDYKIHIDEPCPKCRANLLTKADFKTIKTMLTFEKIVNFPIIKHIIVIICLLLFGFRRTHFTMSMNGTGKLNLKEVKE